MRAAGLVLIVPTCDAVNAVCWLRGIDGEPASTMSDAAVVAASYILHAVGPVSMKKYKTAAGCDRAMVNACLHLAAFGNKLGTLLLCLDSSTSCKGTAGVPHTHPLSLA